MDLRLAEGCRRCPALVTNRRCIVHGYGLNGSQPPLRILFVGEAPGYKGADLTGVPFTRDRSGVRLQQALIDLGLSEERDPHNPRPRLRCFVTNVVRCNPPSNRTPLRDEIQNCLPYLWQEMDLVQPDVVVPIGNVAARVIFPRLAGKPAPPITRIHAQVVGRAPYLVPMRHPARISNADLARFVAALHGLLAQGTNGVDAFEVRKPVMALQTGP
jgi:uracil-DNA glycosylase family 4